MQEMSNEKKDKVVKKKGKALFIVLSIFASFILLIIGIVIANEISENNKAKKINDCLERVNWLNNSIEDYANKKYGEGSSQAKLLIEESEKSSKPIIENCYRSPESAQATIDNFDKAFRE